MSNGFGRENVVISKAVWLSQTEQMWEEVTSTQASAFLCFIQTYRPSF
jgi:hypothetical protein